MKTKKKNYCAISVHKGFKTSLFIQFSKYLHTAKIIQIIPK